jgi:hypothetical protein
MTRTKSKKLSHLSHISAATWIGVGLAFGALVVAVYYGAPMWRLARWTALNDFRVSCISDHDRGLQESTRCKTLLADPAKPPPVVKRTFDEADEHVGSTALRWAVGIAVPIATLVVFLVRMKGYAEERHPVSDSMAKSDIGMMTYKHGTRMQLGHVRAYATAQEHEERERDEEEDHSICQAVIVTKDTSWGYLDYDDDLSLARDRYYFDPNPTSLVIKTGKRNEAVHHSPSDGLDQEPDDASDSSSHHRPTVKDLLRDHPRQPTWAHSTTDVKPPAIFDGPLSLLNFGDGSSTKDLRINSKSNRHLRAISVPIDSGASTCRLRASYMFTEKERKLLRHNSADPWRSETAFPEGEDPIVWQGKVDTRARIARLFGLHGRQGVFLVLDPKFVEDVCLRFGWITEFEWESDGNYTLPGHERSDRVKAGEKRRDKVEAGIKSMGRFKGD